MTRRILVCFAVKEEARPFLKRIGQRANLTTIVTGIGPRNAEKVLGGALLQGRPDLVITSGFAGALDPELKLGDIVFETDETVPCSAALLSTGARSIKFHCADTVAATTLAKRQLWKSTQCQAVEMESVIIRRLCREQCIPSATIRVISDTAHEDLPLDFNQLMTAGDRIDSLKLARALLQRPGKIIQLIRFQRRIQRAAETLGRILEKVVLQTKNLPKQDSASRMSSKEL
ncbi:MAG: hypothetical protein FJ403_13825 [Verrucomicrobia bacterium]|nr:hypothetical protein [Verrucomicrobiota bacterium]